MTRALVALVSIMLFSGTAAFAEDAKTVSADAKWASFKTLDSDGSGRISRGEWAKTVATLKLDPAPAFEAMDANGNNGIDEDEWAAAEKITQAYSTRCREASKSWCHDFK